MRGLGINDLLIGSKPQPSNRGRPVGTDRTPLNCFALVAVTLDTQPV